MKVDSSVVIVLVTVTIVVAAVIYLSNYSRVGFYCSAGECPTNILTGQKSCPADGGVVSYDPASEVCNLANSCNNSVTAYSLLPSGATQDTGVCLEEQCSCFVGAKCADWVATTFKISSDSVVQYTRTAGSNIQIGSQCYLPIDALPLIGCPIYGYDTGEVDEITQEIKNCMLLTPQCGFSPLCDKGILAQIDDPNELTPRFACITTNVCECGQIAKINPVTGEVTCFT